MLYSALLIHLTGGRIETHFHVFGSLAFLAFYRDWRVFIPATAVVAVDHMLRAVFWPESVFGILVPSPWRAVEHSAWVLFEDVFLIWSCLISVKDLKVIAWSQAALESAHALVEEKVGERTSQLVERTTELEKQTSKNQMLQIQLLQSQKLESIGQLAAGIAHEINTPMQFISDNMEFLNDCVDRLFEVVDSYEGNLDLEKPDKSWETRWKEMSDVVTQSHFAKIREEVPKAIDESLEGIQRVIHIVRAMQQFSHPGTTKKVGSDMNDAIRSAATITRNRWKYVAELELDLDNDLPTVPCLPAEINQVLLNLIVNAADAIAEKAKDKDEEKGKITVRSRLDGDYVLIEVEDTGCGISDEIRSRIFDPFFTTKDVGKGTGQGLAISYNAVVDKHQGKLEVDSTPGVGSVFRVYLPRAESVTSYVSIDHDDESDDESERNLSSLIQ
jgi:signal transduction histidine kinase